jgi:hypothetical protein
MVKKKAKKSAPKKAKKVKKEKPPEPEPVPEEESYTLEVPEEEPRPKEKGGLLKKLAVIGLGVVAVAFILYFLSLPGSTFAPGRVVDQAEFTDIFSATDDIYIVMDVRGVADQNTMRNILQCGVDFAGSSGMGGKNPMYFSVDNQGCVAPDGYHDYEYCFSQLQDGLTIYVHKGSQYSFHENGMVVGVGPDYAFGTCGIHRMS